MDKTDGSVKPLEHVYILGARQLTWGFGFAIVSGVMFTAGIVQIFEKYKKGGIKHEKNKS